MKPYQGPAFDLCVGTLAPPSGWSVYRSLCIALVTTTRWSQKLNLNNIQVDIHSIQSSSGGSPSPERHCSYVETEI